MHSNPYNINDIFRRTLDDISILDFDFLNYYYQLGNLLKIKDRNNLNDHKTEVYERSNKFLLDPVERKRILKRRDEIRRSFFRLLISEDFSRILWILYEIKSDKMSLLSEMSNFFRALENTFYHGMSNYKINNWLVHILAVSQILSFNIPRGRATGPLMKDEFAGEFFEKNLKETYLGLNAREVLILRICGLIHDIGVLQGVKDHEFNKNERSIRDFLSSLNLQFDRMEVEKDDIISFLDVFIESHCLLNEFFLTYNHETSLNRLTSVIPRLKISTIKLEIKTLDILYLFSIADLIGIDDLLFTQYKAGNLLTSVRVFNYLMEGKSIRLSTKEFSERRIKELVPGRSYNSFTIILPYYLNEFNIRLSDVYRTLDQIAELHYAVHLIKGLYRIEDMCLVFLFIILLAIKNKKSRRLIIRFDPEIDSGSFISNINKNILKTIEDIDGRITLNGIEITKERKEKEDTLYVGLRAT